MLKSNDVFFSGSGYKEVQFHMAQGCLRKSRLCIRANAIDAVCSIVGCNLTDINGHSYDESNNYLNLRINELFLKKLLSLTHEEKNKLRKPFDYFIVDFITIYLERTKGKIPLCNQKSGIHLKLFWIFFSRIITIFRHNE